MFFAEMVVGGAETSRLLNTSLSSVSVLRQLKDRLDLQIQRRS